MQKVVYTAWFVDEPDELLQAIPPKLQGDGVQTLAHHLTIRFRPEHGLQGIRLGERRRLLIHAEVVTPEIHAVLVRHPDNEPISTKEYPHITIATAAGVPPQRSDEAIAAAYQDGTVLPIAPEIAVAVTMGFFDGASVHTK